MISLIIPFFCCFLGTLRMSLRKTVEASGNKQQGSCCLSVLKGVGHYLRLRGKVFCNLSVTQGQ
ncbi:unnamed protein product [Cylicocyclus nassatus]|uniref:Uncharacterized protein n=1 Tax=Cylicocyclus nassatus TaxID=53992 RepID=A0AA36H4Q3_CYLNA|nr:unnamed protein product [Cylicocyclus nassatus]